MPDLSPELLALGFIWYVAFLFSTTCHEAAHALAAKIGGTTRRSRADRYRSIRSRTSSGNPGDGGFSDPVAGRHWLPFRLGQRAIRSAVGAAASPPGRVDGARRSGHELHADADRGADTAPRVELPLAAGRRNQRRADFPTSVLGVFFFLNLLLGTFNLLPVPPLDGSTGIMLFMGESRAQRYLDWLRGNSYVMVGLVVAVFAFGYIFGPIERVVMDALLPEQLLFPFSGQFSGR